MLWQHVCESAVWSFIRTKWEINHGTATVGLCSLSVRTINLQLPPSACLLPFFQTGVWLRDLHKQLLLCKRHPECYAHLYHVWPNQQPPGQFTLRGDDNPPGDWAGKLCASLLLSLSVVIGMDYPALFGWRRHREVYDAPQMASAAVSTAKICPDSFTWSECAKCRQVHLIIRVHQHVGKHSTLRSLCKHMCPRKRPSKDIL